MTDLFIKTPDGMFVKAPPELTAKQEKCKSCSVDKKNESHSLVDSTIQLILCMAIIFVMMYGLSVFTIFNKN